MNVSFYTCEDFRLSKSMTVNKTFTGVIIEINKKYVSTLQGSDRALCLRVIRT